MVVLGRIPERASAIAGLALCAILYWLTAARPLVAEPWQWADDGLYLLQGERIVQWVRLAEGPWLGEYNPHLLGKAPGFAIWLAAVHFSGAPLRAAEFALLLVLPLLFHRAVRPLIDLRGSALLLAGGLLVAGASLAGELRLLRNGLQAFAAGGALIAAIAIVVRAPGPARIHVPWAALLGFLYAVAYLNREESPWLLPAGAGALMFREAASWRAGDRRGLFTPMLTFVATTGAVVGMVCLLNWKHYGLVATSTRRAAGFTRLHHTLTRLQPQHRERYVPITTRTRFRAYSLSPAFARFRPFLDGPAGDEIATNPGHNALNGRPAGTREFYGSNFTWALLRAADHAGAHDPASAERLFASSAAELETAIRSHGVRAGVGGFQNLNAPMPGDHDRIARSFGRSALLLITVAGTDRDPAPVSSGAPADIQRMADLTHSALAPTAARAALSPGEPFRRRAFQLLVWVFRIVNPACLLVLLACAGRVALVQGRSRPAVQAAGAALLLLASLASFCLTMALYDVLAVPILLNPSGYNRLGHIPLAVSAAYAVTVAAFAARKARAHL